MNISQFFNLFFIFIAIVCGIYGITSIIIRTARNTMKAEASRIEEDIINRLKGPGFHNANRW